MVFSYHTECVKYNIKSPSLGIFILNIVISQLSLKNFLKVHRQIIELYLNNSTVGYLILPKTVHSVSGQKRKLHYPQRISTIIDKNILDAACSGQHTVTHRSNPALPVLHNPCSKNAFYIFKLYQKKSKEGHFHDI